MSARKSREILLYSFWLLVASSATLLGFGLADHHLPVVTLQARHDYQLEVASTLRQQTEGLSGRPSMSDDHGMLFSFPTASVKCFWMKDMRFPLDIIWADSRKRVVHIEFDVSPKTYPKQFCPSESAQFVIELNSGQAGYESNIYEGSKSGLTEPTQLRF